MMCFGFILWIVSLMTYLRGFHAFTCDENCANKPVFTPSRLVVKFGDPTFATCFVCQHACSDNSSSSEKSVGADTKKGTTTSWTFDKITEWNTSPVCHYTDDHQNQCCRILLVTVYQPPKTVHLSFLNHSGDHSYTLQCTVQEVAPVANLNVTFYRGERELGQQQVKDNKEKTPVNATFTLDIKPSKEDDGGQYWCEAKLDLGAEGPQPPPVVKSGKLAATVRSFEHNNSCSTVIHSFSMCFILLVFALV